VIERRFSGKKITGSRYERDKECGRGLKAEAAKVTSVEIQLAFLPVEINCLNITVATT